MSEPFAFNRKGWRDPKAPIIDFTITLTLTPAQLRKHLSPEGKVALAELPKIKDPTC